VSRPLEWKSDHVVEISLKGCDSGTLLKLVSIFHSRDATVTNLQYTLLWDGSSQVSANFHCLTSKATTVARSLRKAIHVEQVNLYGPDGRKILYAI
jgi:hypothetical protein